MSRFERANTVSAANQVKKVNDVQGRGRPRIMFVGNSITLHGVKPDIGWHNLWGMAASAEEKDYVHQTMRMVHEVNPNASYMIEQNAAWEMNYWEHESRLDPAGRDWEPDIIVSRIGENVREANFAEHDWAEAFERMLDYYNPSGKARLLITTLFWPNEAKNEVVRRVAAKKNAVLVELSDLGTRDDMKAIGLFEHEGVAAHPGDLGMLAMAERIFEALKPML